MAVCASQLIYNGNSSTLACSVFISLPNLNPGHPLAAWDMAKLEVSACAAMTFLRNGYI